jgi:putative ABC transport system ATP-binding protein
MVAKESADVIRAEEIEKIYSTKKIEYVALKNVSVAIRRGEFVTILGPSGSGKTTLMNLLGTLDRPTKGKIYIDGVDTSGLDDNQLSVLRNRKVGFIFQAYNLVPYLSTLENVILPLMVEGKDTPENIEKAKDILKEIGIGNELGKKPNEMSGGQQQRVAIARALVNKPPIIIGDEPTGNLDSKTSDAVMNLLMRMAKENNTTMIIATHDPDISELSERSIYMKDGVIEKHVKNRQKH